LGTTNDPVKYDYFKPNLLEEEAQLIDGQVCNSEGVPFAIVHQYDRIPSWIDDISCLNEVMK
jgi:hypothetical protein